MVSHSVRGDRDSFLGPSIPFVYVKVGAADAGLFDFDQDIIDTDGGLGHLFEPETRFGLTFD